MRLQRKPDTTDHVAVNIEVLPIVSVWVDDATVNVTFNRTGPNERGGGVNAYQYTEQCSRLT